MLETVIDMAMPVGRQWRDAYSINPATMSYRDSVSVSSAAVAVDHDNASRPAVIQLGDGHTLYSIGAGSYYKLDRVQTVWGHASFTAGKHNNVRMADCLDYELLAPYMMGDDKGGDITIQRYAFGGGWTRSWDKWTAGVQADYRAEIGHRSHDPRIRDIVSDLNLTLGASYRIGKYAIGIDGGIRFYHQDCDVDYYNMANTTMTRMLSGLGSIYTRFDNNVCDQTGHSLRGYNADLTLVPAGGDTGVTVNLRYRSDKAKLILRDYNNLTLGITTTRTVSADASWRVATHAFTFMPTVAATVIARDGTENLFGPPAAGSYDQIGSRDNYRHNITTLAVAVPVEWRLPSHNVIVTATPHASTYNEAEKLLNPERKLHVANWAAGLNLDGAKTLGSKTAIMAGADITMRNNRAYTPTWGGLDLSSATGSVVASNYEMATADVIDAGCHAGITHVVNDKALSLDASYRHTDYRSKATANRITVTLSLTF